MRRSLIVLSLLIVTSCVSSPAEERVRTYFALPSDTPADTLAFRSAILSQLPRGTTASDVERFLTANGVGRDGLSAYYPAAPGDTGVVSVEFDRRGIRPVATSYAIRLAFDSSSRLRDVQVVRWITGP